MPVLYAVFMYMVSKLKKKIQETIFTYILILTGNYTNE